MAFKVEKKCNQYIAVFIVRAYVCECVCAFVVLYLDVFYKYSTDYL